MIAKTVLLATADRALANDLALRCLRLDLAVCTAHHAAQAVRILHESPIDAICYDLDLPVPEGSSLRDMLLSEPRIRHTALILIVGAQERSLAACEALRPYTVRKSPQACDDLESLLCRLMHRNHAGAEEAAVTEQPQFEGSHRPRVLCIDDDAEISKAIKLRLDAYGIDVFRAFNGMQGYRMALDCEPDVIVTDLLMPNGEGNYVFGRFNSHPLTKDVPVIILTGQTNPALKRQMLSLGASAYMPKPLVFEDLLKELRQHIDFPSRATVPQKIASLLKSN